MKKFAMLFLSLFAAAFLFTACANTEPTKENDSNTTDEAPALNSSENEAESDTEIPTGSDDEFAIEPVTLKTEPAEDITEDIGDIVESPVDENPEIPEENPEEPIGEGEIPEESSEEESLPE